MLTAGFMPVVSMECILKIEITKNARSAQIMVMIDTFKSKAIWSDFFSLKKIRETDCIVLVIRDPYPKLPPGRRETNFFKYG